MPRGQKRSEIEIIQAQIEEAEKKRQKNLDAANAEKKKITQYEKQIEKKYADDIAKACRTKGIPLEKVLQWVLEQPVDEQADELAPAPTKTPTRKTSVKKAPSKRAAGKKPSAKKPAARKPTANKPAVETPAEPQSEAPAASESAE